ncbi:MAG: Crp/Fnr family transcriptional regulator [Chloroflexota bacterium]|nr:Crp/Fnr family transcriptional regulator [Chloroflexota bacterium]
MANESAAIRALKALPYFKALNDDELARLARTLIERTYEKDTAIFFEGEPCQGLYIVRLGSAKIFKLSPEGREQILSYVKPGDSFNEVAVFDGGPSPANVIAAEDTTLWIVPRAAVVDLLQRNPAVALAVIQNLGMRLRHLVGLVEDLSLRQVSARLAKLLLETASGTERALTQQEMAARLGTVREMIGRSLRQLETRGLIKTERGKIVILDRGGLERLV